MSVLVAATAAFLLTHFVSSTPLRAKLVGAMGEWPYRGLYSAIAFVTLAWMIIAYGAAPREVLWIGSREIPRWAMPFAFVLLACGYWRNPTMVGADKLLKSEDPARGIIRITRHPIMWAIMLWAAAHVVARGDSRGLVFFGGFLLLALGGTLLIDRRKTADPDFRRFAAVTSNVPFVAVAQGRNRIVWREIGWKRPLIGLAICAVVFFVHPWITGGAQAQAFPQRPLRMLVGFAPGGANDIPRPHRGAEALRVPVNAFAPVSLVGVAPSARPGERGRAQGARRSQGSLDEYARWGKLVRETGIKAE